MIRLVDLIKEFQPDLEERYGSQLLPGHGKALSSMLRCRTEESGSVAIHCHDCEAHEHFHLSCGHRSCPQCQHAAGELWIERQRAKLLPCDYFLITVTLPAQLRALVYEHQSIAYDQLIKLTWETLAQFGLNDKKLRGKLGATIVLHTHSRALNFHPHVHVVIPAGAVDTRNKIWREKKGKFLFDEKNLAKVFRGKWFQMMNEQGWKVQENLPEKWIVDCKRVGNGDKALTYLGRYLYRGVIREKDILQCANGKVTYRYTENSGNVRTNTLDGADFLWLLLKHVLPKGFRRSRDYGFLHGNNKRVIHLLHLLFKMCLPQPKTRPPLCCKHCGGSITLQITPYLINCKPPDLQKLSNWEMPMQ
jgi:hypothetical protein